MSILQLESARLHISRYPVGNTLLGKHKICFTHIQVVLYSPLPALLRSLRGLTEGPVKNAKGQKERSTVPRVAFSRTGWSLHNNNVRTKCGDIRSLADWIYWSNIYLPDKSLSFGKLLYLFHFEGYMAIELVKLLTAHLHECKVLDPKSLRRSMFQSPFPRSFALKRCTALQSLPFSFHYSFRLVTISLAHLFCVFSSLIIILAPVHFSTPLWLPGTFFPFTSFPSDAVSKPAVVFYTSSKIYD